LLFIEWLDLDEIARQVNLRPYHFLLYVTKVLGLTPHQYLSRTSFRARVSWLRTANRPPPLLWMADLATRPIPCAALYALCFAGLQCGLSFLAWLVVLGVSPSVGLRERMR
jgi:hypothetical protein